MGANPVPQGEPAPAAPSEDALVVALLDERDASIRGDPMDEQQRRAKRFFFELDLATNNKCWSGKYDPNAKSECRAPLFVCRFTQFSRAERGAATDLLAHLASVLFKEASLSTMAPRPAPGGSALQDVSDLMRGLLLAIFVDGQRGFDLASAQTAFEMFAGGVLRYRSENPALRQIDYPNNTRYNGEPDGANLFIFAAFALFAATHLASETERAFWEALAPCFIWIRAIYLRAYPSLTGTWMSHSTASYRGEPVVLSPSELAALREPFAGLTLRQLHDRSVQSTKDAFKGLSSFRR